jgi:hypothetical protein
VSIGGAVDLLLARLGDGCWEACVIWVLRVRWVVCLHVVVDQFAYPLGILVDLAACAVVVFGILYHALEVALDLGDSVVAAIVDLVLDGIYRDWQSGEFVVVW